MGPRIDLDEADPRLESLLAGGLGDRFEYSRQQAVDKLERIDEKNGIAFWLQAIGDGSPMENDQESQFKRTSTHQIAYIAGYHDELIYPDIAQIATRLFAHHNGMLSDHSDLRGDPAKTAHEDTHDLISIANQLYPSEQDPDNTVQLPELASMEERCNQAIALLNESDLTTFWLQLLTYEGEMTTFSVSSEGKTSVETWPKHPIEYIHCGVEGMRDPELRQQLFFGPLIQHIFVAARTADQPLDKFAERCVKLAFEYGYYAEEMTKL